MSASKLMRATSRVSVCALLVAASLPSVAGSSADGGLQLNMSSAVRSRMFWSLQAISTKTTTKSEGPRDITGPVVSLRDLGSAADYQNYLDGAPVSSNSMLGYLSGQIDAIIAAGGGGPVSGASLAKVLALDAKINAYGSQVIPGLTAAIQGDYANGNANINDGLGSPKGILAKAGDPSSTVALSLGYYLDDANKWAVEALVLGAPVRATVYGAGTRAGGTSPLSLDGQALIQTKMIPPIVKFGYNFGSRDWLVRPYAGVAAMYAVFFDSKTTNFFNDYQGGKTSVSIKNALGIGPMLGLSAGDQNDSGWQFGVSIGKIRLKTEATLVTRNTMITSDSLVSSDYGAQTVNAIKVIGEQNAKSSAQLNLSVALADNGLPANAATVFDKGLTTEL